jgi:subtilisin family serine protease
VGLSALLAAPAFAAAPAPGRTEVVVTLEQPSLARFVQTSRVISARTKARRLDLSSPTNTAYLSELAHQQTVLARRIERAIPSARVRWRYRVVLDGLAVDLPSNRLDELARLPGVARVDRSGAYRLALFSSPQVIGADQLWGLPDLSTAGQGIKIGIIDQGVDQAHQFFDPTGYVYPPGFPKGDTAFTTPKVIVARSFPPPGSTSPLETLPFADAGGLDDHGTHVAGIAAGNHGVVAAAGVGPLSGVAPRAYLGNYKAMAADIGRYALIENAPELIAAIEAAVNDGMDVINMSLGEIELGPTRSIIDQAVDGAADAGVVPVVAAGNDFEEFGRGSINTPGSAPDAITVAAATKDGVIAGFSSSGPTPLSREMKPDVTAPGVSILSSVPPKQGTWASFSGTSMATPHVAGGVALLRQRHPSWTVAQIKSALVLTGDPVYTDPSRLREAPTTREGGGMIDLPKADNPLVFAEPADLSFGLLRVGRAATRAVALTDAGGGTGTWTVSVQLQGAHQAAAVSAPATIDVPGTLTLKATAASAAPEQDVTGFVLLQKDADVRRIPFWFRVDAPRLEKPTAVLTRPGVYKGDTRRGQARVSSYRYPDDPIGAGVANNLPGKEQVFRVRIRGTVANFGVVVTGEDPRVDVTPRIVQAGDENRLLGYRALPIDVNPYLDTYGAGIPAAGAVTPAAGVYDLVFDTSPRSKPGPFTFRLWVNDTSPPTVKLLTRTAKPRGTLTLAVTDTGSGVSPTTIDAEVDGQQAGASYSSGRVTVRLGSLTRGTHQIALQVSDYQEEKNSESVSGILPNTRLFRASFSVS